MPKPWGAWYEADYVAKTRWFTTAAQHGIYRGLLGYYGQNGPLPGDEDELRAICSATSAEWAAHWPRIQAAFFFLGKDGLWHNERADDEWHASQKLLKRFSKRGKKAAEARWGKSRGETAQETDEGPPRAARPAARAQKTRPPPPDNPRGGSPEPEDVYGEVAGNPPTPSPEPTRKASAKTAAANDDARRAVEMWNETAARARLAQVQNLSTARLSKLKARLKECGGLDGWAVALKKIETIPGLHGGIPDVAWKADFDWLLAASKFTRLMEGGYDNWYGTRGASGNTKFGGRLSQETVMEDLLRGAGIDDSDDRRSPGDDQGEP